MGKGDKKTKRGKIISGSFGVRRPRNKANSAPVIIKAEKIKAEPIAVEANETKKPAAKKPVVKKAATAKSTKKVAENPE